MNCKECKYAQVFSKGTNARKDVYCEHPNQEYIYKYFEENRIQKMPCFLGFTSIKGEFPIKRSPKWCPLKKGGAE